MYNVCFSFALVNLGKKGMFELGVGTVEHMRRLYLIGLDDFIEVGFKC